MIALLGIGYYRVKVIRQIRIKATIEVFLEEFDPSQNYLLSISDIEGYETQFIEFEIWGQNDGPIPGIKLFKDLNIYLEREYCEYESYNTYYNGN